ncbi:hypothetical protein ABVT39_025421 [Epinephelus coioides]
MASLERRMRKVKFDPIESEVLVDEANKHYSKSDCHTKELYMGENLWKSGGTVHVMPLTSIEEQVQLTFCEEQVTGIARYDALDLIAEQESSAEVQPSPSNPPKAAVTPAEPRKGPEDIDLELLQEQKKQSAALQTIAREMRAASSLARAVRCGTQAIATHCRTNGVEAGRQSPTATARQPGTREGGEVHKAGKFHLRERKHK